MLNFYELLTLVNDCNDKTFFYGYLKEDFLKDFRDNLKSFKTTDSAQKQGIDAFMKLSNVRKDKTANTGLYCSDCQVLGLPASANYDISQTADISAIVKNYLSNERQPAEVHIKESLAIGKSLLWKYGKSEYYIEIDGNYFCLDRIYEMFRCLKSDCEYADLITISDGGRKALMLKGQNSFAFVLPFIPTSVMLEKNNATYKHFMEKIRTMDDKTAMPF